MAVKKKAAGRKEAKAPASAPSRATVLLDEHSTPATTKELRAAGFSVESNLESVGVLTGTVPSDKLDDLKKISGVKSVEVEHSYQLPPPESDIQ
jgi:predicted flap endonuclease-1-like 5' DNA nuclease